MERLAQTYTQPNEIAAFLHQGFRFRDDRDVFGTNDYWQSPEEFLTRRLGDCEDYAVLARELLARNGVTAYLFSLFGEQAYAHTVCVFLDDEGRYNLINQDRVVYYRASSLEALASRMNPSWTTGGIVIQEGTHGRVLRAIYNAAVPAS